MPRYYDRAGNELSGTIEWAKLFEDKDYQRVDVYRKPWVTVSTVWLGLDHGFNGSVPLIFETMVFARNNDPIYEKRYATLEQAIAGHKEAVKKYCWRVDLFLRAGRSI
jgi:hypothetical protein